MNILLIQVDGKLPNLALMKLSRYHKNRGDSVYLNHGPSPSKVYISCIFSKNRAKALGLAKMFSCPIEVGGYGVSSNKLPFEIEHLMPDYDLYGINYSIGFTSRGCIRSCPFCIVPKNEGQIAEHSPLSEFLHPSHNKVLLYDNNFLASPLWKSKLEELIRRGLKVCMNEGIDIRLVNDENAPLLAQLDYRDTEFKNKRIYSAYDWPQMEKTVREGIELLEKHGVNPKHLMFYLLVGYNTTLEEDLHRVHVLEEYGSMPYIMRYHNHSKELNKLARWMNRGYHRLFTFEEFRKGKSATVEKIIELSSFL